VCADSSDGDGSQDSPFGSISTALAGSSAVVLVADGSYAEALRINRSVRVIAANTTLSAPDKHAIKISGAVDVSLSGLRVQGATGTAIWLDGGAKGSIDQTQVIATEGIGILVTASDLQLTNSEIAGSSSIGVELFGGSKGIIDDNCLTANTGGGIRADDSGSDSEPLLMRRNELTSNREFGIAVVGSKAIIDDNCINSTALGQDGADGIVVISSASSTSDAQVIHNEITGNARIGVWFDAVATGLIDDNDINDNGAGPLASGSPRIGAGIWLRGAGSDAPIAVTNNRMKGNSTYAVGASTATAAKLDSNVIKATKGTLFNTGIEFETVGDGIALFSGSSALISNNAVSGSERAGVFLDSANGSATSVNGNAVDSNAFAIIVQAPTESVSLQDNTLSNNSSSNEVQEVAAGTYAVVDFSVKAPAQVTIPE